MRQDKIMVRLEHNKLLAEAVLTLAQRIDPTPYGRHTLAEVQIQALNKRGVDLPAVVGQDFIDRCQGAKHHPMAHPYQASLAHGFDDLRIEQPGTRHPPRLGGWPCGLAA